MNVFLDQDGVLFDLTRAACNRFGIPFRNDLNGWNLIKEFGATHGVTREGFDAMLSDPGFWETVRPYPWAHEMVDRLLKAGAPLYILTICRFAAGYDVKYRQLIALHPGLEGRIIVTDVPKHTIAGHSGLLIDDGETNLRPMGGRGYHWLETADAARGRQQMKEVVGWVKDSLKQGKAVKKASPQVTSIE
jgi:5'(3')-deoxyribonucleotidase